MKKLLLIVLTTILTACTQPTRTAKPEKVKMPQDCQSYFDGLKALAKKNANLAKKFGDKLEKIDDAWQNLEEIDRQKFSEQCIIRNKQLQEMKGTPELEELLNEL